jgi:TP901 family phage tail tape measure protein
LESQAVLNLLLTARYVGSSAFGELGGDIAGLNAQTNSLTKLGSGLKAVGDIMMVAGAAAAIGVGLAVKESMAYDQALQRIVAVMPDHLAAQANSTVAVDAHTQALMRQVTQLQALKNEVNAAAVATGQDPTALMTGSYYLFSSLGALGLSNQKGVDQFLGQDIIGQLAAYARASGPTNAGGVSFDQAAQDLPRLFTAYGMPVQNWTQGMGIFTYLENQAHLTQSQLVQSMSKFTPAATAANISFEQAALLMAAESSSGVAGSRAGTESSTGLITLLGSPKAQAELAKLGLSNSNFFDKSGNNPLPMYETLALLQSKLVGMKAPDRLAAEHDLFGLVGLRAYGGLLNTGMGKYENLIQGADATGVMKSPKQADMYMQMISQGMMQGPKAQFDSLMSAVKLFGIAVGEAATPAVLKFISHLKDLFLTMTGIVNDLQSGSLHMHGFAGAIEHVLAALGHLSGHGLGGLLVGGPLALLAGGAGLHGLGSLAGLAGGELAKKGSGGMIGGALTGLGGGLGGLVGGMFEGGMKLGSGVVATLTNSFFTTFRLVFGMLIPLIPALAGNFILDLVKFFGHLPQLLLGVLTDLPRILGGLFTGGFALLRTAIAGIIPVIAGIGSAALPVIGIALLIAGAIAILVLAFLKFRPQVEGVVQMVLSVVVPAFHQLVGVVLMVVKNIQGEWTKMWPQISAAMMTFMTALKNAQPVVEVVVGVIKISLMIVIGVIGAVLGAFIHALPGIIGFFTGIVNIVTQVATLIMAVIHGQWGQIPGIIMGIFGAVIGLVFNAVGTILGFIKDLVGNILGFFGNLFDKLVGHSIIPDMIRAIIFWFGTLPLKILGFIIQAVTGVLQHIGQFALDIIPKAKTVLTNLLNVFSDLPNKLLNIGIQAMQGLANGIKNAAGNAVSAVSTAAGNVLGTVKGIFGIHSPSTVFMWHGEMMMRGMAQGIEGHAHLVRNALSSLGGGIDGFGGNLSLNGTGPLHISELHVGNLHLPPGAFPNQQQQPRQVAPEYQLMRGIQERREQATGGYDRSSGFSDDHRYSYQFTR